MRTKTIKRFRRIWLVYIEPENDTVRAVPYVDEKSAKERFFHVLQTWAAEHPGVSQQDRERLVPYVDAQDYKGAKAFWEELMSNRSSQGSYVWVQEARLYTKVIPARGFDVCTRLRDQTRVLESFVKRQAACDFIDARYKTGDARALWVQS